MCRRENRMGIVLGALALALLGTTAPLAGAGFSIFEQGSKAMGMAGAFTAQADDASALFHNAGGLGFFTEREVYSGVTIIQIADSTFEGADPFPGSDAVGSQEENTFFPAHIYYVEPINDSWVFGFGFNSPYGLVTDWDNEDSWVGRYLNIRAEVRTFDLNPSLGWRINDDFSLGFGLVVRLSNVELVRRVPAINPFNQTVFDAASVTLNSDERQIGYGANVGLLHKVSDRIAWGFSYRSRIEVDYDGRAQFSQNVTGDGVLDAIIASMLPVEEEPIETSIEFPDTASLGLAVSLTPSVLVEADVNWTGWSSFDEVAITFRRLPELSETIPQDYDDVFNFRLGARFDTAGGQWRCGVVYDETPQPDTSVGPLLPDADRIGLTLGYGWHDRVDLAVMYLDFDERTTTTNRDDFNGTYDTEAWLFGLTLKLF